MFQNISEEEIEKKDTNTKKILAKVFELKNVFLYIISFLVSMVGFGEIGFPFALAIFAATCSNNIASGIVYVLAGAGTLIKFGKNRISYIFTYNITIHNWNCNFKT